MESRLYLV